MATRRSHRPAAHARGARFHRDPSCRCSCTRRRRAQLQHSEAPQDSRVPHCPRLVPGYAGAMADRAALGHAAVLARGPASLCPGMFDDVHQKNAPIAGSRSAPRSETRGRKSMLSPADMTRLSEHIMRITDVLCPQCCNSTAPCARMARRNGASTCAPVESGSESSCTACA